MDNTNSLRRFHRVILSLGLVTLAVYATAVLAALLFFHGKVREQILQRDGILLTSVAQHLHEHRGISASETPLLDVALESSEIRGIIAVRLYDSLGGLVGLVPSTVYSAFLMEPDLRELRAGQPVIRHFRSYSLENLFSDQIDLEETVPPPVTEVLAPVQNAEGETIAIIQYWLDGSEVAAELAHLKQFLLVLGLVLILAGALIFLIVFVYARQRLLGMGRLLAERNKSLEKANADLALAARTSAIGTVSSHLFHGLKNPLAGLKTYLRLTGKDEEAVALTDRMQSLIDETLNVLREAEGELDYDLTLGELTTLLENRLAPQKTSLEIVLEGDGEGRIEARKAQLLTLVIRNLVDNAIEASPPGKPVRIRAEASGSQLRVEVRDEGSGLPERIRTRLFEPVQSAKTNGSGIGLAISAAIARQIPARLALENSSPAGTTFSIELKL